MATQIPNYFFLDDKLYKFIRAVKNENLLVIWGFEEEKRLWFNYQQTLKRYQKAFTIQEVSELIGHSVLKLKIMMKNNLISRGSGTSYAIATRRPLKVYWSEDDVFNLRSEIYSLARKNKYGEPYSNFNLISEAELLNKMRGGESYFIQDKEGKFVKVWRSV